MLVQLHIAAVSLLCRTAAEPVLGCWRRGCSLADIDQPYWVLLEAFLVCRYDVFPDMVPVANYADFGRRQLSASGMRVPPSPAMRSGAQSSVERSQICSYCTIVLLERSNALGCWP